MSVVEARLRPVRIRLDAASREPPPANPSADRAVLTALFAISLVVFAGARIAPVPNLAVGAGLGVLIFGVGTAPLQRSGTASLSTRLGVAGLVGLSTMLLVGVAMALLPLWHPVFIAVLLVAVAGTVHAVALPAVLADLRLWDATRERAAPPRLRIGPSLACTLAGTSLWLGSAISTGRLVPRIGGFPWQITPVWYVGVALVLGAIALALWERRERYAAAAAGSLVLATTLTPALVYGMPRAQAAAKHVEIVNLIASSHGVDAGDGIYFAYSGLFGGVAWLCDLAGVTDVLGLATFWPVLIGILRLATLWFLFSRVVEGQHRRWAGITLVVLVDALGADYFSPQSVGYVLGFGIVALALGARPPVDRRLTAGLIVLGGLALAPTHQLSPYVIGSVLLVLAAFGCARPRWAGLAVLVPAGLWALVNYDVVGGFLTLSSIGDFSNFEPPEARARPGLSRDPIVAESSGALTIGMVVLIEGALIAVARHRRERWAWAYLASAGVGLFFVAIHPYGNEGIFRATLFGIPWLALLAVHAVRRPSPVVGGIAWMAVSLVLFANFLVAAFGMDATGVMRRGDLEAMRAFARTAPPDAYLLKVGFGDLPSGAPHVAPSDHEIPFTELNAPAAQAPGRPTPGDLTLLTRRSEAYVENVLGERFGGLYAVWSPVSVLHAHKYALQMPAQSVRWRDLLLASPSWRLVYRRDGTYLFRWVPRRAGVR